MNSRGSVVRFIDVVLILLFGFISISNTRSSHIDLLESAEGAPATLDSQEVIFIGVQADGVFLFENGTRTTSDLAVVRQYFTEERDRLGSGDIKVRIRSSKDAPVQRVLALSELCNSMGLDKVLEVEVVQ